MDPAISTLKVQPGEALHRQIANHIRTLIYSGKLASSSKLPRMHDLARVWGTNYFTVHTALTTLLQEGLLERKPRLGTFIRKRNDVLRTIGIYYGDEILVKHERMFYRSLHMQLLALLQEQEITSRVYIDCRPEAEQNEPLIELSEAVSTNAIQGLIAPLKNSYDEKWLLNIPVPTSFFSTGIGRIHVNIQQMFHLALTELKSQGCKSVGLISPEDSSTNPKTIKSNEEFLTIFLNSVAEHGMKTRKAWTKRADSHQSNQEMFGYRDFHRLWSLKEKPDGLLVYPENVSRGVVIAALERQVKVPAELKLVLHKNQNVEFLCPLAASWVITREHDVAAALLQQLRDRYEGIEPENYEIHHELIQATPNPLARMSILTAC